MEVEFFWKEEKIGATVIMPKLLDLGAIVVVKVPHVQPDETLIKGAFVARAADGRRFTIDIVRVRPNTSDGTPPTSTLSGYLRAAA